MEVVTTVMIDGNSDDANHGNGYGNDADGGDDGDINGDETDGEDGVVVMHDGCGNDSDDGDTDDDDNHGEMISMTLSWCQGTIGEIPRLGALC